MELSSNLPVINGFCWLHILWIINKKWYNIYNKQNDNIYFI